MFSRSIKSIVSHHEITQLINLPGCPRWITRQYGIICKSALSFRTGERLAERKKLGKEIETNVLINRQWNRNYVLQSTWSLIVFKFAFLNSSFKGYKIHILEVEAWFNLPSKKIYVTIFKWKTLAKKYKRARTAECHKVWSWRYRRIKPWKNLQNQCPDITSATFEMVGLRDNEWVRIGYSFQTMFNKKLLS